MGGVDHSGFNRAKSCVMSSPKQFVSRSWRRASTSTPTRADQHLEMLPFPAAPRFMCGTPTEIILNLAFVSSIEDLTREGVRRSKRTMTKSRSERANDPCRRTVTRCAICAVHCKEIGVHCPLTRRAVKPQGMGMLVLRLRLELRTLARTAELALEPLGNCMPSNALCNLERKRNM